MNEQDLVKQLRARPYSNPSYWMLEAADEIERLRQNFEQDQVEQRREFESHIGNDPRKKIQQQADEIERLRDRLREQTLQTQATTEQIHKAVIEALGDAIPAGIDPNGHPTEQVVATTISTLRCDIERLKSYTAAYNTLLAERVEIECLRGLAIRAWHSFRSGLTATGGCRDGLTDGDILELVKLSNVEAAKLREQAPPT